MTKCWLIPFLMAGLLGDKAFADCLPAPDTPASVIEYFQRFNKPLPEQFCAKEAGPQPLRNLPKSPRKPRKRQISMLMVMVRAHKPRKRQISLVMMMVRVMARDTIIREVLLLWLRGGLDPALPFAPRISTTTITMACAGLGIEDRHQPASGCGYALLGLYAVL
jgi:hypothetical protein